jgi:hypothetical protein
MLTKSTVAPHVYDYLLKNHRQIPNDFVSLTKLACQEGWTETHRELARAIAGIRGETYVDPDREDQARAFIARFNCERKANKNRWIWLDGEIDGIRVQTKSYNTWIQIAKLGDKRDCGPMDCSVKDMNEWLTKFLKSTV